MKWTKYSYFGMVQPHYPVKKKYDDPILWRMRNYLPGCGFLLPPEDLYLRVMQSG